MKVGQFPVEAALVEEKMDIVTAKDFLSAGKLTRCRRCDAAQALVRHLGNISMIKIERKVKAKVGWSPLGWQEATFSKQTGLIIRSITTLPFKPRPSGRLTSSRPHAASIAPLPLAGS